MIKLGTSEIKHIYIGSTPIKKVYRGSTLIWSSNEPTISFTQSAWITGSSVSVSGNVNNNDTEYSLSVSMISIAIKDGQNQTIGSSSILAPGSASPSSSLFFGKTISGLTSQSSCKAVVTLTAQLNGVSKVITVESPITDL